MRRNFPTFRRAFAAGVFALLWSAASSTAHGQRVSTEILAVVPFTLSQGHIFVAIQVNGRPATFLVDTGSGADIVDMGSGSRLGALVDRRGGSAVVTGTGGTSRAYPTTISTIQVEGVQVRRSRAFLLHLSESVRCDGVLGYEFLRRFVTTFDFERGVLTLRRPGAAPPGQWAIPFVLAGGVPSVVGEAGGWVGRFVIDTGCGGTVILNAPFAEKYHLRDRFARDARRVTGRGVGGATEGDLIRLDSFQLGRIAVDGVTAELSRQAQGLFVDPKVAGTVGIGVLDRYTVTMDYPGSRMILTANGVRP